MTEKRRAFLDLLLIEAEKGADLSDEDILNEVATFMFEVYIYLIHRTACSLPYLFYFIKTIKLQML